MVCHSIIEKHVCVECKEQKKARKKRTITHLYYPNIKKRICIPLVVEVSIRVNVCINQNKRNKSNKYVTRSNMDVYARQIRC